MYFEMFGCVLGLPWTPKVRTKDLDAYLEATRLKFLGFPVEGDRETLVGLPAPIHEGVKVLKDVGGLALILILN